MAEYSQCVVIAWNIASAEAKSGGAPEIEPGHLLLSTCKLCDVQLAPQSGLGENSRREIEAEIDEVRRLFQRVGLNPTGFRRRLRAVLAKPGHPASGEAILHRSQASRLAFKRAEDLASSRSASRVGARDLLQAVLETPEPPWRALLQEIGLSDPLRQIFGTPGSSRPGTKTVVENTDKGEPPAAQPSQRRTPTLDQFGRDLTRLAREGKLDTVIGRKDEIRSLVRVLMQKRKNNAMLVGEAGVGKTAVVEGLTQWLVGSATVPVALRDSRLIEVPLAGLLAGTKYRGEFEERMQAVIREARTESNIILFIDEVHMALGAGSAEGAPMDAANMLKPALARGDIRCIGATTIDEYRKHIEKDPALDRRFQLVWVDEPSREETLEILKGLRPKFEAHHGLKIADEALEAAVQLSMRYVQDFRLPDKAIDLVDQACAGRRVGSLSGCDDLPPETTIGRAAVAAVVSQRCRVPVERLTQDEAQRLLSMEEVLGRRIIGQDEAVRTVCEAIRTARAGLHDPRRPVGVFLFVGGTGTGKTELAKALAEFLFDDEARLVRIDMSEYKSQHDVSRLIGASPGYIGYDQEGQLTGPVRTNPYSVVLFDEIEKAHPQVLDILLQVLDDGRLTDSHGRHVSFRDTVIVLTSNLGTSGEVSPRPIGFLRDGDRREGDANREMSRKRSLEALRSSLRPELLDRVRNIVSFNPLDEHSVRGIIDKLLARVRNQLAGRRVSLALTPAAYDFLMQQGFAPRTGAREMERAIDRLLVGPLGRALLEGRFAEGAALLVDAGDGELLLEDSARTRRADPEQKQ